MSEISSSPESYHLELVRVQATHRRVSAVNDPDQGGDPTVAISSGVLVENSKTVSEIFSQPGKKSRSLLVNTSTDKLGSSGQVEMDGLLANRQAHLYTVGFETVFWTDTEASVDGVVLAPGSKAREFAVKFDKTGITQTSTKGPLLYVTNSEFDSQNYESVRDIQNQAEDGDVVSITANLYGQKTSVQETIEHTTPCGVDVAQIPTPSGPICVDVLQDTLIHAGAVWTSVPETQDDVLLVIGLSSQELDAPSEQLNGEYRIRGEVVSTSRVDSSLPEGRILVIYDLERVGDTDYESVSSQSQDLLESQSGEIQSVVKIQIEGELPESTDANREDDSRNQEDANGPNQSGSEEPNQQTKNENEGSFLGIKLPDWFGGNGGGFVSGIIEDISKLLWGADD